MTDLHVGTGYTPCTAKHELSWNCWEESGGRAYSGLPLADTRAEQHGKAGDSTSLNETYEGKHRKCNLESHGRQISAVYITRTKGRKYVIGHSIVIMKHVPGQQNASYNL